jgi:hypothetical protein
MHNYIAEINNRSMSGESLDESVISDFVDRHFYLPYANTKMVEQMKEKALKSVLEYFNKNRTELNNIEYVEKNN